MNKDNDRININVNKEESFEGQSLEDFIKGYINDILEENNDSCNLKLPDPEIVNFYKLQKDRIIYIMGGIDISVVEFSMMIQLWNIEDRGIEPEKRKPIKLFIFSEGGEDAPAWNLVDVIKLSKTPVYTINCGYAMSNGLTLLVAGHKRFALEHSVAMYHSGSAGIQGTKEQVDAATKYIANQDKIYEKWFTEKVNIDQKLFNKKKKSDWYLTAEEMLEYGMIDEIVGSIEDII